MNKGLDELLGGSARLPPLEAQTSSKPFSEGLLAKTLNLKHFNGRISHFTSGVNVKNGTGSFLPPFFQSLKIRSLHPAFKNKPGENCKILKHLCLFHNQNS